MTALFATRFKSILLMLILPAAALAAALFLSGCGDTAEAPVYDIGTGSFTTKTSKGPVSQEAVDSIVKRKLGDTDLAGKPMVRSIAITPEEGGQHVEIEISRTSSCHPGQVVGTAVTAAQQIMSAVFRYDDVSSIRLGLYGTTEEPKDLDKLAVRIMVTKAGAAKIDWFQFNDQNVETLASEFWAEPEIYSNWKQYGGAAITDEAQKAAANAPATTP